MPIWVSGAAGKLGAAVVEKVRAAGTEVVAVDRVSTDGALQVDLRDYRAVAESMAGADSVIHLAAIPSPGGVQPSVLVENNTMSTFNVFEAAAQRGIDRVVIASSGSIYGYAWSPTRIDPAYVPVDEATPFEFVDPYALTKDLGERIGAMFARRGMTVLALRLHWIVAAHELRHLRDRFDAEDGVRNLWGYVELDDAARACVLAATAELSPGEFHPTRHRGRRHDDAHADRRAARPVVSEGGTPTALHRHRRRFRLHARTTGHRLAAGVHLGRGQRAGVIAVQKSQWCSADRSTVRIVGTSWTRGSARGDSRSVRVRCAVRQRASQAASKPAASRAALTELDRYCGPSECTSVTKARCPRSAAASRRASMRFAYAM